MSALPDARDIARMVPLRQMLQRLGWHIRGRNRSDCGLCRGSSKGTVSFTADLWKCHRCNEGGDVFSLVRAVNHCQFPDALRYVADLAGVRIEGVGGDGWRREMATRHRQRDRIEHAAEILAQMERTLRQACRDTIDACDRLLAVPGPWSERQWQRAHAASVLRDDYLLPEYTVLSFGPVAERARCVLRPGIRAGMAAEIRWAGGMHDDAGRWIEVLR
jgi:hypothetical protein